MSRTCFSSQNWKKKSVFLLIVSIFLAFPFSFSLGAMSGGAYELYADDFSTVDDSSISSGAGYTLRSTGGEFGAGTLESAATGSLSVNAPNIFFFGETFILSDGVTTRTFEFRNGAGGINGTLVGDHVIVDTGGGGGSTAAGMAIRIRDAINDTDAAINISASSSGSVVTVTNRLGGAGGNIPITETVVSDDFVVTGMSGGGSSYALKGGFQAMEKGILSLDFTDVSISLGALSLSTVASTTVTTTISTDSSTGYSLTFDEDGNLRSGANDIDDVADGAVTAGSEEYGLVTSGGGGTVVVDTAIVDGFVVASSLGGVNNEETALTFKAAIGGNSRAGSYSHSITATLSVNP